MEVPPDGRSDDLTLQLVDDEPITGQIVDLEGKPVPGATLQVLEIHAAAGEDLGPWLEAAKAKKGLSDQLEQQYLPRVTIAPAPKVTTDAEGRFRLTGIGRNRLVVAQLDGPTIVSQHLHILTRPGEPLNVVRFAVSEHTDRDHDLLRGQLPACGRPDQADRRRGPRQGHEEAAGRGHDPQPSAGQ